MLTYICRKYVCIIFSINGFTFHYYFFFTNMNSAYYFAKYFSKSYFVCPQCETVEETDFQTFQSEHQHLGPFSDKKKKVILLEHILYVNYYNITNYSLTNSTKSIGTMLE